MNKHPEPTAEQRRQIVQALGRLGCSEKTTAGLVEVPLSQLRAWLQGPLGYEVAKASRDFEHEALVVILAAAKRDRRAEHWVRERIRRPEASEVFETLAEKLNENAEGEQQADARDVLRRLLGE